MTNFVPAMLNFSGVEREKKFSIIKRTHEIFNGLHGKELTLLSNQPPGRTDTETYISIPFEDPECDLVHKHEWQHVFFKTDLRARAHFVDQYTSMILNRVPRARGQLKEPLEHFLHSFCNGVDDIRVASLWHRIYPQSAEDIEDRWKRLILEYQTSASNDLTLYCMAVALDVDNRIPNGPWSKWRPEIDVQMRIVKGSGFPTVLIAVRRILDHVIDDMLQEFVQSQPPSQAAQTQPAGPAAPGAGQGDQQPAKSEQPPQPTLPSRLNHHKPQRTERQKDSATKAEASPTEERTRIFLDNMLASSGTFELDGRLKDTSTPPQGLDPRAQQTSSIVQAALGRTTPEREQFVVDLSNKEIERIVQKLRATKPKKTNPDGDLLRGMEDEAGFVDLGPKYVEKQELNADDSRLVSRMRTYFARLGEKKRRVRSDEGSILDPIAYFELLLGTGDADIFEDEHDVRGFSALALIDMSGSMMGIWDTVARATLVLARSLKFPFSKFEVWGFTGNSDRATIFRFVDPQRGYASISHGLAFQATPLSYAIEAAIRRLEQMEGSTKHLFVLTDGLPTPLRLKKQSKKSPIEEVGDSVKRGRSKNIETTALIIGDLVSDKDAVRMFGDSRHWKKTKGSLFKDFTSLVEASFAKHLRGK